MIVEEAEEEGLWRGAKYNLGWVFQGVGIDEKEEEEDGRKGVFGRGGLKEAEAALAILRRFRKE